jgi:hypothetical protein
MTKCSRNGAHRGLKKKTYKDTHIVTFYAFVPPLLVLIQNKGLTFDSRLPSLHKQQTNLHLVHRNRGFSTSVAMETGVGGRHATGIRPALYRVG